MGEDRMTFCRLVIVERPQSSVVVVLDLPLALVCHEDLPASPCAIAGLAFSIGNENRRKKITEPLLFAIALVGSDSLAARIRSRRQACCSWTLRSARRLANNDIATPSG
jgi:hypothetical protein